MPRPKYPLSDPLPWDMLTNAEKRVYAAMLRAQMHDAHPMANDNSWQMVWLELWDPLLEPANAWNGMDSGIWSLVIRLGDCDL